MNLKFSLRDLLLATLVSALAVGWWTDHGHQLTKIADQQRNLSDRQAKLKEGEEKINLLKERITRMKEVMDLWAASADGCHFRPAAKAQNSIDPFAPLPPRSAPEPTE